MPVYELSQENTQPDNRWDIGFEKAESNGGTVNRTSLYAEAAIQRVRQKRCCEKFHKIHKKTSVPKSLF